MCKVTDYIDHVNFGKLYDLVCSQLQYFEREKYWEKAEDIRWRQPAIWERLMGSANGDRGDIAMNLICFHLHLNLSKRTSPYSIIREIREYFTKKIGSDIFKDHESFRIWESQFPSNRFDTVSHNYQNLINDDLIDPIRNQHRWDNSKDKISATCTKCGCRRFAEKLLNKMTWIYIEKGKICELTNVPACL